VLATRLNCRVDGDVTGPKSFLHERQDLGPKFLHTPENLVGCRAAETEIDAADTNVAKRPDVGGYDRRRTG